jgi:hypothetical protein
MGAERPSPPYLSERKISCQDEAKLAELKLLADSATQKLEYAFLNSHKDLA